MTGEGFFRRRYKYTRDNRLLFAKLKNDGRKPHEYQEALRDLIEMIYEHQSDILNYHHLNLTIPQYAIPLVYEGAHCDIAYAHPAGHIVYLMVLTRPWSEVRKHLGV